MKPCSKNLKQLSWLAIDALDAQAAQKLQTHLTACPGCRRHLEEIKNVAGKLSETNVELSETNASDRFHRQLVKRIADQPRSPWAFPKAWWQIAIPALGFAVVVLIFTSRPSQQPPSQIVATIPKTAKPAKETPPTFGEYRMLANQSWEALDKKLTAEARVNLTAGPIYKAFGPIQATY